MRRLVTSLAFVPFTVALIHPGALAAQSPLGQVESLISEGRMDQARSTLERWWSEERVDASPGDRQHALWLRGRLTLDGEEAELDFRRLVVEHPGGPWSDDALLRLGQGAHVDGDLSGAAGYFRTLVRDYPGSPLRDEARAWLDRFGSEVTSSAEAPDTGEAERTRTESSEEEAAEVERPYAVQLGAFSGEQRARRLWERVRSAGLEPRLVRIPGSGLIRVRVGAFPDSPSAEEVLRRVRGLGFEATIVTDALEEEPLR